MANEPNTPRLLLLLQDADDDLADLARVLHALPAGDLSVICANAGPLREALIEVKAGETLRRQAQGLQGDPVAERELRGRTMKSSSCAPFPAPRGNRSAGSPVSVPSKGP